MPRSGIQEFPRVQERSVTCLMTMQLQGAFFKLCSFLVHRLSLKIRRNARVFLGQAPYILGQVVSDFGSVLGAFGRGYPPPAPTRHPKGRQSGFSLDF
jgi:hypothetical protein